MTVRHMGSQGGRNGQLTRAMSGRRFWQDKVKARDHHNGQHVENNITELQNVKRSYVACGMDQWVAVLNGVMLLVAWINGWLF